MGPFFESVVIVDLATISPSCDPAVDVGASVVLINFLYPLSICDILYTYGTQIVLIWLLWKEKHFFRFSSGGSGTFWINQRRLFQMCRLRYSVCPNNSVILR